VLSQVRLRRWRAIGLAAAILVAAASFSVLTAAGRTTDIRVRGSVESNYRTAYDILVRPKGNQLPLEREQALVRNNYLSGLFGGISLAQWRKIKDIPGVDIAAPIANIGFVIPYGGHSTRIDDVLTKDPVQLYRVRYVNLEQAGSSRYGTPADYIYYTRRNPFLPRSSTPELRELVSAVDGAALPVCPGVSVGDASKPFWDNAFRRCYSERSPGVGDDARAPGRIYAGRLVHFPVLISAIDPVEEAKLLALDRALVSGRYLRPRERPTLRLVSPQRRAYHRQVPVIASTRTYVDQKVQAVVERLAIPRGTNVPRMLASNGSDAWLNGLGGREVLRKVISTAQANYDAALAGSFGDTNPNSNLSWSYWAASPTRYRQRGPLRLRPIEVRNPLSVWRADPIPGGAATYQWIPRSNADVQFRMLEPRIGSVYFDQYEVPGGEVLKTPVMKIVGRYDPEKLPGFSELSEVPLETYYPPELLPADGASRKALGGKPLLPSTNLGDYVAQPPLFLTTLEGMKPFLNPEYYAGAKPAQPISVIRVRVKGVTGPDALSQARIRQVATEIHDRTGLQVDITAGSSPRELLVELPAGKFGRPELLLQEGWSKKGVSVSFLQGLDHKRLVLLSLILVSCAFFLGNGAFASVRGRRTEIGTLRCMGWPAKAIFSVVLAELAIIGALAGLAAAGLSLAIAHAASLELSVERALLAAPLALGLALVAGIIPAWKAARVSPLEAVRPAVSAERRRHRIRSLFSLGLSNVRRMPARTLAGAAGLFLGVAALTLLVAVNQAFQGRLVGTLLGEVVSAQVRGLDFLVVGVIVLLAGLSLADVLYLNLRERAAEFVTLKTVGWEDRDLARVIAAEALALGLAGALPGALLGAVLGLALGAGAVWVLAAAALSVAGGLLVALVASLVPLVRLSSLTAPGVLAEE
jgi:putative ABC transport system permease protein